MNASAWELIRAVRGPILLITFGVLVALNHMDKIEFERTWPVLIIVYGLTKLLERMVPRPVPPPWQGPQGPYPAPPPPGYTPEYQQYQPSQQASQTPQGGAQ